MELVCDENYLPCFISYGNLESVTVSHSRMRAVFFIKVLDNQDCYINFCREWLSYWKNRSSRELRLIPAIRRLRHGRLTLIVISETVISCKELLV